MRSNNSSLQAGLRWSTSVRGERELERGSRETRNFHLLPPYQTPSRRIALLFTAPARDSKKSLLAG